MPKKISATSRRQRNVTTKRPTWMGKVDAECLAFLDAYKLGRSAYKPPPSKFDDLGAWLSELASQQER